MLLQKSLSPGGGQLEFSARDLLALSQQVSPTNNICYQDQTTNNLQYQQQEPDNFSDLMVQPLNINSFTILTDKNNADCQVTTNYQTQQQQVQELLPNEKSNNKNLSSQENHNQLLYPMKIMSTQACNKYESLKDITKNLQIYDQLSMRINDINYQQQENQDVEYQQEFNESLLQLKLYPVQQQHDYQQNSKSGRDLQIILGEDSEYQHVIAFNEDEDDMSNTVFKCNMQSKDSGITGTQANMMQSMENYSGYLPMQTFIEADKKSMCVYSHIQSSSYVNTKMNKNIYQQLNNFEQAINQNGTQIQNNVIMQNTGSYLAVNTDGPLKISQVYSPKSLISHIKMNQVQSKKNIGDLNDLVSMDDIESQQTLYSKKQSALNSMLASQKDLTLRLQSNNIKSSKDLQQELQQLHLCLKTNNSSQSQLQKTSKDISEILQEHSLNLPNPQSQIKHIGDATQILEFNKQDEDSTPVVLQSQSLVSFQNLERQQLKEEYRKLKKQLQEISKKNKEQQEQLIPKTSLRQDQYVNQNIQMSAKGKNKINQNIQNNNQKKHKSIDTSRDVSTIESIHKSKNQTINSLCVEQQVEIIYDNQQQNDKNLLKQKQVQQSYDNMSRSSKLENQQEKMKIKNHAESTKQSIKHDKFSNSPSLTHSIQSQKLNKKLQQAIGKTRNQEQTQDIQFRQGKLSTLEYPHMHKLIQNSKHGQNDFHQKQQQLTYQCLSQSARTSIANLRSDHIIKSQKHCDQRKCSKTGVKKSKQNEHKSKERCKIKQDVDFHNHSTQRKNHNKSNNRYKQHETESRSSKIKSKDSSSKQRKNNQINTGGTIVIERSIDNHHFNDFLKHRGSITPQDGTKNYKHQCRKHSNQSRDSLRHIHSFNQSPQQNSQRKSNKNNQYRFESSLQRQRKLDQLQTYDGREKSREDNQRKFVNHNNQLQFLKTETKKQRSITVKNDFSLTQKKYKEDDSSSVGSQQFIVVNPKVQQSQHDENQKLEISPTKLNKELNKILETERMIKEYKEVITKMQRDIYSKKTVTKKEDQPSKEHKQFKNDNDNHKSPDKKKTPIPKIQAKRIFQEDINLKEALLPLLKNADKDSLRVQQIQQIEDAIEEIKQKIENPQPKQCILQGQIIENQLPEINRESLLSYPSTIKQDPNFVSDSKFSRISISPKKQQQKFTPNKNFTQRNHSRSTYNNQTIFTSFPSNQNIVNPRNRSSQKPRQNNSVEKSIRFQSNDFIPAAFYDKTIIPEEDYKEEPTRYHNGNQIFDDESMINAQQQQEILNFYREFQQEDETVLPTNMSIISKKQQSFVTQSPMILKSKRRLSDQSNWLMQKQKLNSQLAQMQSQNNQRIKQSITKNNEPIRKSDVFSKYANQEVKVVKIQINKKQQQSSEETASKFHEIMKITGDLLSSRQQQLSQSKTRKQENTPSRNRLSTKIQCASKQNSITNTKVNNNNITINLNRTSTNQTHKLPNTSIQSQRINIEVKRPGTTLSTIHLSANKKDKTYQSSVSQALYKKSAQKNTQNQSLTKFLQDTQRQSPQKLSQQQQNEQQYFTQSNQYSNVDEEYMTFSSTNQINNLQQQQYINDQSHQNRNYSTLQLANTLPCSLRNSLQIKTQTIDLGAQQKGNEQSGVKRQQWNNASKRSSLQQQTNSVRTSQTRNSLAHSSQQQSLNYNPNCTGIFNSKNSINSMSGLNTQVLNQSIGMINSARASLQMPNTNKQISNTNNYHSGANNKQNGGRNSQQSTQQQMYSSIPITKLNLKM